MLLIYFFFEFLLLLVFTCCLLRCFLLLRLCFLSSIIATTTLTSTTATPTCTITCCCVVVRGGGSKSTAKCCARRASVSLRCVCGEVPIGLRPARGSIGRRIQERSPHLTLATTTCPSTPTTSNRTTSVLPIYPSGIGCPSSIVPIESLLVSPLL